MDETGFQMSVPGKAKTVIPRAEGHNYVLQPVDKSWASVQEAANGGGETFPL
jgi:virulence-associated protein VagC